jgi:hypothetical protein
MSDCKSKLAISSGGYVDYYDHHFCSRINTNEHWKRNNRMFPARAECFSSMQSAGVITAEYDTVKGMCDRLVGEELDERKLVVYTDELSHQGFGKELMTARDALKSNPHLLCSAYYAPSSGVAISLRELAVGNRMFLMKFTSDNDWRSNVNTTDAQTLLEITECPNHGWAVSKIPALMRKYRSPIFAIDYVYDNVACINRACDMNLAPGMRGCGLEEMLPAREAAACIEEAYWRLKSGSFC